MTIWKFRLLCNTRLRKLTKFGADYWKTSTSIAENVPISFKHDYRRPTLMSRCDVINDVININNANLRDLIAATGLVILIKFDPNHRFFSLRDLEIWCMTSKNNRAPILYYIKLCVSFQIHRWIETEVTVRKRSIWVKIGFVHHFVAINEFKLEFQSRNAQFWSKSIILLAVWPWNLIDDLQKQQGTFSMLLQALCSIS